MTSYQRFKDEEYKNWLTTAEILYILRRKLHNFVENETETYHSSLKQKLKGQDCTSNCDLRKFSQLHKKPPICGKCEKWKDEILKSHAGSTIHWNNCMPHLWPTEKWEVAKVFMPGGQKDHRSFKQFDISAILNFMDHCKHFKTFKKGQLLNKIINTRNKVMHSPDFSLTKDVMDESIQNVLQLSKILEPYAPELKTVSDEIQQFNSALEKYPGQVSQCEVDGKDENMKLLDKEQQALKERIEFLAQHYQENQSGDLKEELRGIKSFLDQNKDLLENLGPQVERLDEIQEKVQQQEERIDDLDNRVDQLERVTNGLVNVAAPCYSLEELKHLLPAPVLSDDPLKFKNHLFEEARRRNLPEPVFKEIREATGFRGQVEVNGRSFTGTKLFNSKKNAHQEVASTALVYLTSLPENTEGSSTSALLVTTSTSSPLFYGSVTIILNQEVISDEGLQKQEAIESAYRKLADKFGLTAPNKDNTFQAVVEEHFKSCNFELPLEQFDNQDGKNICKLSLSGHFTFKDEDGATKKKQAEQQAAKAALQQLSGVLNCNFADGGENYKGLLKECIDALGMEQPVYNFTDKNVGVSKQLDIPSTSRDHSHIPSTQTEVSHNVSQSNNSDSRIKLLPTSHADKAVTNLTTKNQDSNSPSVPRKMQKVDNTGAFFYGSVTVTLNQEVISDEGLQRQEAIESAYRKLANIFSLTAPNKDSTFQTVVEEHFKGSNFKLIEYDNQDGKDIYRLQLSGHSTFYDKEGSTRKKQAEQQAAKVALQQLSGVLNCNFPDNKENYKGFLKERLDALGMEQPNYDTTDRKVNEEMKVPKDHSDITSTETVLSQDVSSSKNCDPDVKLSHITHPDNAASSLTIKNQDSSPSSPPRKMPKVDNTEINDILKLYHLKSETVEDIRTDQNFSCTLHINLDNFTFKNKETYNSKRDATRKTYCLLGHLLGICEPTTDEATKLVKQAFSQKSLPHPTEVFEQNVSPFCCSLTNISYSIIYEGKGSTEDEAKQDALLKTLDTFPLLFGYEALPKSMKSEENEDKIKTLLRNAGQKDIDCFFKCQYKVCVDLQFKDYTMETNNQGNKKANRSHLSKRILGLLGAEIEPNCPSVRNRLDEWFKERNLQQPVFEDTEDAQGSKITFNVKLSLSHPDWEDSDNKANEMLCEELRKRFQYLTD